MRITRPMRKCFVIVAETAAVFLCSIALAGKPGGHGGPVHYVTPGVGTITEFSGLSGSNDRAYAVLQQSDGKWLLGGTAVDSSGTFCMGLARYNADYTPDTGFGTNAVVTLKSGRNTTVGTAMALQPDGKIVMVGSVAGGADIAVARFNANGSIDTRFNRKGILTYDLSNGLGDVATAVAIDDQGRIVVGGRATAPGPGDNQAFAALRLRTDGTPDPSFGGDGVVVIDVTPGVDFASTMAIDGNGSIVLAGYCDNTYEGLARILPDGTLDPTFVGGNGAVGVVPGVVVLPLSAVGNPTRAQGVCVREDDLGNLVLLGKSVPNSPYYSHLVRLGPTGDLDLGFNGGLGYQATAPTMLLDSFRFDDAGNIIAVGSVGSTSALIMQFNPDGTPGTLLSPSGAVTMQLPGSLNNNEFTDVAITTSGLVLGGFTDAPIGHGPNYLIRKYP